MARQGKLIEPINNATMEDVARAILKKKKQECEKDISITEKKETTTEKEKTED